VFKGAITSAVTEGAARKHKRQRVAITQ